jgi:hypothetical protein
MGVELLCGLSHPHDVTVFDWDNSNSVKRKEHTDNLISHRYVKKSTSTHNENNDKSLYFVYSYQSVTMIEILKRMIGE